MIIAKLGQISEMIYMDLSMIAYIFNRERINLSYIIIKRLCKVWSNKASTLVHSNLFTKMIKREKIKLSDETKNIAIKISYDIYSKKTLGIMHMVKHDSGWDFRNPTKRGNPSSTKFASPKAPKNAMKQSFAGSFVLFVVASLVVEQKLDLVATFVKQLQEELVCIKATL